MTFEIIAEIINIEIIAVGNKTEKSLICAQISGEDAGEN